MSRQKTRIGCWWKPKPCLINRMTDAAWQSVKATTKPLANRHNQHPATRQAKSAPDPNSPPPPPPSVATQATLTPLNLKTDRPRDIAEIDRRRMLAGDIRLSARLDLHGLTKTEAETRFAEFITACYHQQYGYVLAITGKGQILRARLPQWLYGKSLADKVVAFCHATAKHGGDGAWYIKIRRRRHQ